MRDPSFAPTRSTGGAACSERLEAGERCLAERRTCRCNYGEFYTEGGWALQAECGTRVVHYPWSALTPRSMHGYHRACCVALLMLRGLACRITAEFSVPPLWRRRL